MAGKILILAGAPEYSTLKWDSSLLYSELQEPIARFAGLPSPLPPTLDAPTASVKEQHAVWRSLPLEREKLNTGLTQQYGHNISQNDRSEFLTPASFSIMSDDGSHVDDETTNQLKSQFYEQSLAIHEQIPSSQLLASQSDAETQGSTSFLDGTTTSFSFGDTTSYSIVEDVNKEPLGKPLPTTVLKDIPAAVYILSAQPATVTVNLLVGIISLSPPRTIRTRWGSTSSLVEVLVGDDTKSGFAITFWLPGSQTVEESQLAGLRPQDVVLLQNVALNVFMKKVYGSSLRKDMTKVSLLYRRKLDRGDQGGYYSARDLAKAGQDDGNRQLGKTRRVWEWVLNFVGTGTRVALGGGGEKRGKPKGKAAVRAWDMPPPDTQ